MMKSYFEYSERERSEFTTEQIKAMLAVVLMEKGVPTPVKPALLAIPEMPPLATKEYFGVRKGSYSDPEFVFDTMQQALAMLALSPRQSGYDYNIGSELKYAEPFSDASVITMTLRDKEQVKSLAPILKEIARIKRLNSDAEREYGKALALVEKAESELLKDWHDMQEKSRRMHEVAAQFLEYLKLCDGNALQAGTFLRMTWAKTDRPDDVVETCNWFDVAMDSNYIAGSLDEPVPVQENDAVVA